jgi:phasin family protein
MIEKAKAPAGSIESWPDMKMWTSGWTPLLEANRLAVDNWVRTSEAILGSALALSQQMAEFTQARLREDVGVCERLAKCQSPSEAAECQREFAKTATAQYLGHANKLSELMTELTNAAVASAQHAMTEGTAATREKTK